MSDVKIKSEILPDADPTATLLRVEDLRVEFHTRDGIAKAVNGASFSVESGETLAIVGESGSGKSVTSQAIMGILESPPARIAGGEVLFHNVDLLKLGKERARRVRGNHVAMVFQDALSALNPVWTVGFQLSELFRQHRGMSKKDAMARSLELLDLVKIPAAAQRLKEYPHQFSGGMRQRVMIAMALALDPDLLIADEPTTALDVTVQAQIMRLLKEIQIERHMGLILITHDLGVVADVADKISVMYAGRIVEQAPVLETFATPAHPYTKALLKSIPRLDTKGQRLEIIKGLPPVLTNLPPGCNFAPRCAYAQEICTRELPVLATVAADRAAACHFSSEVIQDV
ncbi:ABC transporter ATP-binding protein [Phytomonospora endophytica]|uniref:Oligopeptide/dipeptide ABC transporter ATP-binding protein n=1 Tax=Phytomonospora endophytica TaxID=714109 RepID=A0A841F859_9ACTN|nr:ABC transporter ATP-binding protein [Phytomonospora endophytica]MBB6033251.1 oligopeptide/dipeptide ABC transporter ATP-binding protein [Phytomonospora endophytica]GIG65477.1 ABC transporter ATP-binding protein [Phytomonospora endophytica]